MNLSKIIEALADGKKLVLATRGGNSRVAILCHRLSDEDLNIPYAEAGTFAEAGTIWDALSQLNLSMTYGPWDFAQMYGEDGFFPTWWRGWGPETYGPLDEIVHSGYKVDIRQNAAGNIELTSGALEIVADNLDEAFNEIRT